MESQWLSSAHRKLTIYHINLQNSVEICRKILIKFLKNHYPPQASNWLLFWGTTILIVLGLLVLLWWWLLTSWSNGWFLNLADWCRILSFFVYSIQNFLCWSTIQCDSIGLDQGNLLRGIDIWSRAAKSLYIKFCFQDLLTFNSLSKHNLILQISAICRKNKVF